MADETSITSSQVNGLKESKYEENSVSSFPVVEVLQRVVISEGQEFINQAYEYSKLASEWLQIFIQPGKQCFDVVLAQASTFVGKEPSAARAYFDMAWKRGVEFTSHAHDFVKPYTKGYLQKYNINPLWVWSILVFILCFMIAGLKMDVKIKDPIVFKSPRILLPDGRNIAYEERGASEDNARHNILIIHGFLSSRFTGISAIKDDLLKEFGIRLVSYDRPGFGESDINPHGSLQSSAQDIVHIANALQMGNKFWIFAHSVGGIYAWAAIKYIPERLAGVAMLAPSGNLYSLGMNKKERSQVWRGMPFRLRLFYMAARWAPSLLPSIVKRDILGNVDKFIKDLPAFLGTKDQALFEEEHFNQNLKKDILECIRQRNPAIILEEIILQVKDWGFQLPELCIVQKDQSFRLMRWLKGVFRVTKGAQEDFVPPIHIWQGMDDLLVPPSVNVFAQRMVPQINLHLLDGEGHFSFFHFCDKCHREILETLFRSENTETDEN